MVVIKKKVLVSGIKPTGVLHIGNYFGAMKQNIDLANSEDYISYIFIANYHALTSMKGDKVDKLKQSTFDIACAYLACGLDIDKVSLFLQSDVPEHTELCCIFNNIVTMPYLMRAHAYKDHEAKNSEVNVGLFDYPVLMAADILMYHADIVPVGSDQKQHIEYARDIVGFYNRAWTDRFTMPNGYILDDVATVPGIDGRKMSKSYDNVIPLFATDTEIQKAVMNIVTDSKSSTESQNPDENNIYNIHKLFLGKEENIDLRNKFLKSDKYEGATYPYKEAKDALYESIIAFAIPMRDKYDYYQAHRDEVFDILRKGGEKARSVARATMERVRMDVGLDL